MSEVIYYYLKNDGHLYGCVAIIEHEDGTISKGVSICSSNDTFNKNHARGLAFQRLNEVLKTKESTYFSSYRGAVPNDARIKSPIIIDNNTVFKQAYCVQPNEHEYRMFHKPF